MMLKTLSVSLLAMGIFVAGCGPELGSCDPNEARRLVYDIAGTPAFEGQAMMIQSCGFGAFCHSTEIVIENRRGVPTGLEYDLRLASFTDMTEPEATERLRTAQRRAFEDRHSIWDQVQSGLMPVPGDVAAEILAAAPVYTRLNAATGRTSPSPGIDTPEGQDALRNWLACGLPVVERTITPNDDVDPIPEVGWIVATEMVTPLEPNWTSIFTLMIEPRCNQAPCHGSAAAGELRLAAQEGEGDPEAFALATLIAGRGSDEGEGNCGPNGTPYIVPMDPAGSLFVEKLLINPSCGERMPIGGAPIGEESLEAIQQWVMDGANP